MPIFHDQKEWGMRKRIFGCIVVLCLATFAGGCAKKDVIKTDEAVPAVQAPTSTSAQDARTQKEAAPESQKAEPLPETPTREAAVQPEAAKPSAAGQTGLQESDLQKIYFNFDSAALSDEARATLAKNAELLTKGSSVKVRIEGNCDERGSDEYNMALGDRRAKAARDYLVNLGVAADRLSIISYGEEKPVDQGHDESAWAKNRRDEFVIIK
jgi:peptidoglycan-associated lipoprotein